jgi:hypothetical protein
MRDADPVELGAEIALHPADEVACESLEVGHLGGILGRDDQAEMMPVVEAASREGHGVGAVLGGAERAALLAVPRDAVALEGRRRGPTAAPERKARPRWRTTRALTMTQRSAASRPFAGDQLGVFREAGPTAIVCLAPYTRCI